MSRKWRKAARGAMTAELEKAYAEKEAKIVEEVLLRTPTTYFRLGREAEGEWEDISHIAEAPEDEEVSTVCLGHYDDLIDAPIKIGEHELPRGVVMIVGGPVAGKTLALERISGLLTSQKRKWVAYRYREPIEPSRFSRKHKKLRDAELIEFLARFMVGPNHEAEVFLLDSVSAMLFRQWPTWNVGKFGLNSGLGFWMTDLHDALVSWGKTFVTTANPYTNKGEVVEGFFEFCRGRAGGVIQLESRDSGFYSYRGTGGRRVDADYGELIRSMPILEDSTPPARVVISSRKDAFV